MNDKDTDDCGMAGVSMMICRECRWTGLLSSAKHEKIMGRDVHLCPRCGRQIVSILPVFVM